MIKLIKSSFYREVETKKKLSEFIGKTNWLSFGKECEKFEKKFAKYQGRKYCVMVNSGSSANLALIQALLNLGLIKKGDGAGFSGVTWATNPMPLVQLGLDSVPVDVELDTLNVSSRTLIKTIGEKEIRILFLTNLLGFCDDIDKIKKLCDALDIILIEDNCESLGTVYKGKKLGNFGIASTFSFYVGHHMSTIEGGAICTDNEDLAVMLRVVRAHGWDRNLSFKHQNNLRNKFKVNSTFYSRYTFYDLGYNLRPTEIQGYIGNLQLAYIDEITKKRNDNFLKLAESIYKIDEKYIPIKYDHIDFLSNFAFPVICKTKGIRDKLVAECKNKIEIRPIVGGNMSMQPFFKKHVNSNYPLTPNAKLIHEQGLYFGNNPELTKKDLNIILKTFI
jgi:CDP-6-deoxy-D-xylo-4-hexulose-3-dehydrase